MHQLTQELMREDLQIKLEALKASPLQSIKVSLDLEVPLHQLMLEDLQFELLWPWR